LAEKDASARSEAEPGCEIIHEAPGHPLLWLFAYLFAVPLAIIGNRSGGKLSPNLTPAAIETINSPTAIRRIKQRLLESRKHIVIGAFSLIYLGAVIYIVELNDIVDTLRQISLSTFMWSAASIVLVHLFALARAGAIISVLGYWPGWRNIFLAFSASNITNLPLSVVGQSLTRAMVLARVGTPFSVAVLATYIERVLAAGILFLLSLGAVWYLFGAIKVDLAQGAGEVLATAAGISIVMIVVGLTVLRGALFTAGRFSIRWLPKLWPSVLLTLIIHGGGLVAYILLLNDLLPQSISPSVIAALVIVMLISVLPISFAGWGLRELSAASALSLVGIAPEIAIAAALAIGLIYLATTGLFAVLGLPLITGYRRSTQASAATLNDPHDAQSGLHRDWDTGVIQACAALCAILLFFRLPTQFSAGSAPINVNIADVVVFVGFGIIALMISAGRIRALFPRLVSVSLEAITGILLLGLFVSFFRNNLGHWALYNRGIGWLLMLGYTALGAAVVSVAGEGGRRITIRLLIITAMAICGLQLLALAWSAFVFPLPLYILAYPLQGFANNQNAFAFELLLIALLLIVGRSIGLFGKRRWRFPVAVFVLAVTVYLTGSRTGVALFLVLAILDHFFNSFGSNRSRALQWAAAAMLFASVLSPIITPVANAVGGVFGFTSIHQFVDRFHDWDQNLHNVAVAEDRESLLHPSADVERWQTIEGGLQLWRENPIFGAGMGAYVESVIAAGQYPHGIHSIYIWFLAEMGIVGLGTLIAVGALLVAKSWFMMTPPLWTPPAEPAIVPWGFAMFGALALMATGGIPQDFFFQRIFWFILGLVVFDARQMPCPSGAKYFVAVVLVFGLSILLFALLDH
jgi:O-antigen ligase